MPKWAINVAEPETEPGPQLRQSTTLRVPRARQSCQRFLINLELDILAMGPSPSPYSWLRLVQLKQQHENRIRRLTNEANFASTDLIPPPPKSNPQNELPLLIFTR